jgi:hypothetical protein
MKKLSRREFLRRIALIASVPLIDGLDLEALKADISGFTTEQLGNIKQVKSVEIGELYNPYFIPDKPQYIITKKDGSREYYTKEKYGDFLDYFIGDKLSSDIPKDAWLL